MAVAAQELLKPREAAAILRIGERTLWRWVSEGRVPAIKLSNRTVRFSRETLESWLSERASA